LIFCSKTTKNYPQHTGNSALAGFLFLRIFVLQQSLGTVLFDLAITYVDNVKGT